MIKASNNIFEDLGFSAEEAASLKLRSQLMIAVDKLIIERNLTQQSAASALGISQPRVSDLIRGKTDKFTIDSLVNIMAKLGRKVTLQITNA